ncbi:MAG: hypothetical protein MEQ74_12060 [Paracoccus sp.]|nr:hypothetical protein [Paracoccus sp. (in: a-proteobacteria)]
MSDRIDNGGPAFPACNEANYNDTMGMTLRDWFAGQASVGVDEPHPDVAKALMRSEIPNWADDPIAATFWWAEAEAKLRYIRADAMIAARKGGAA